MVNKIEITNDDWDLIKKIFGSTKSKPQNMTEFKPVYIGMIKNICGSEIISSKQIRIGKDRTRIYNLNLDLINDHLLLNQFINPCAADFKSDYIEMFNIKPNLELLELKQQFSNKKRFELLDFDNDD